MSTITLFYRHDMYEITFSGATIHSIKKYLGDSQHPREVKFSTLHSELQDEILTRLNPPDEDQPI